MFERSRTSWELVRWSEFRSSIKRVGRTPGGKSSAGRVLVTFAIQKSQMLFVYLQKSRV